MQSHSPDSLGSVDVQDSPHRLRPDVFLTLLCLQPPVSLSMPAIDEETAELREELTQLAERIRTKQEEARDNTDLGKPGSK